MNKLILPKSFYETQYKPSDDFLRRLHNFDPLLLVYWNKFQGKWVIDRYGCSDNLHIHGSQCPRNHVLMVKNEEGDYAPLNDKVFESLAKMDMWRKYDSAEEVNRDLDEQKAAYDANVSKSIRDDVRHVILDNKEQFKKIQTTIQMQNMAPNDVSRMPTVSDEELRKAVITTR